ncbi:MAG TPA: DUF2213 domain-containing protein [Candidatus Merdivicinus intestinigallinarum]|nr:DUF2213 domain-containing protein [Candidatus Merdivicinus intestinigallinarum]
MALAYYGAKISPHMTMTPEGYLICHDVPINRTGDQEYFARELQLSGDPERLVTVHRYPEDVFDPAALASFEGKDITAGHPPENVGPENFSAYSKGHVENVRHLGEQTIADLHIKDAALISDIQNGVTREVSCGYFCQYEPDGNGYKQTQIRGNHVAVVPRGRAGHDIAIKDAAPEAEKGRKNMKEFWNTILTAFGKAAREASPEELEGLAKTAAIALDAAPAESPAPEAEPAADGAPAPEGAGNALDARLTAIEAMLQKLMPKEEPEHISDETDLDELMEKLSGEGKGDPEKAVTIEAPKADDAGCMTGPARDTAMEIIKRVRPAVCGIADKTERARVVDALLSSISAGGVMGQIQQATQDSAQQAAKASAKSDYQKICEESEAAYAARNPHKMKEA